MYERVIRKPVLRLGRFSARTGPFEVTSKRLSDCIFGINSRFAQETPVKLKFLHGHGLEAVATNVGFMSRAAEDESGVAFSDLHITEDLKADLGDGLGMRTLATVDQIADQLEKNLLSLSIEGNYNARREGYYEGRTLALEPVAWAILPPDVVPAVPQVAADSGDTVPDVVCVITESRKEAYSMEREKELEKRLSDIEAENDTLKKKNSDLEAEALRKEKEETDKEISEKVEAIAAYLPTAKRPSWKKRVLEKDSPEEKRAVLAEMQALIDDGILVKPEPREEVLAAGEAGDNIAFAANEKKREDSIAQILAENPHYDRTEAELESTVKYPDLWKGAPVEG